MASHVLTSLEQRALARALSKVTVPAWRDALLRQAVDVRVRSRSEKTVGYYVDFDVPPALRIPDLSDDDFNKHPPAAEADHPDGKNGIFFLVYVKDGALSFMEASSTADWPEDEDRIVFVD